MDYQANPNAPEGGWHRFKAEQRQLPHDQETTVFAKRFNQPYNFNESGVVVVFTLFFIAIILSMSLTLANIFAPKIRFSAETKKSNAAAYAAESAVEWCLYVINKGATAAPTMTNGATYTVTSCATSPVRAEGNFQGVKRVYQLDFP